MTAGNGLNLVLLIVSILQLLALKVLGGTYLQGKVKWEGMWVIFVECIAYAAALVSPDADFVSIHLTNGMWIEWMRYAGWILTCPVLLMTLVSMTTEDGTKAPTVRLVPLLVANLTMVLLGITAAANLPPVKWYIFAMALCFGGHVFSSAIQCFLALYEQSPSSTVRRTSLWLCLTFLAGWGCFPCAFLTGHSGMKIISVEVQWALFVVGDMLSKNCWVGLAVLRQYHLDKHLDKLDADLEIADFASRASRGSPSPPQHGSRLIERRGSNSCVIIDEINARGVGFGTGAAAPERNSAGVAGVGFQRTVQRPTPQQLEAVSPSESFSQKHPAPSEGEAADLQVLKSVLARYHAMPPAEREALVPVFAGLLADKQGGGGQGTRDSQSSWLNREMDEDPGTPSIAAWSSTQAASRRGREAQETDLSL